MCCWNSGHLRGWLSFEWSMDDVYFLDDLIEYIKNEEIVKNVKIGEVVVTGYSSGAFMTYTYAINTTKHEIHTIIPVSGTIGGISAFYQFPQINYDPNNWGITFKTNVIHIHGTDDENVLIDGGYSFGRYDMSMEESISFWFKENDCTKTENTIEIDLSNKFVLTQYKDCGYKKIFGLVCADVKHEWFDYDTMIQNYPRKTFTVQSRTLSELIYNLWRNKIVLGLGPDDTPPTKDLDTNIPNDECEPFWPFYLCSNVSKLRYLVSFMLVVMLLLL
jgi:poly(3-hydroxybutyrate) depolymerase